MVMVLNSQVEMGLDERKLIEKRGADIQDELLVKLQEVFEVEKKYKMKGY
jgi:hypothetical protein